MTYKTKSAEREQARLEFVLGQELGFVESRYVQGWWHSPESSVLGRWQLELDKVQAPRSLKRMGFRWRLWKLEGGSQPLPFSYHGDSFKSLYDTLNFVFSL